MLKFVTLMLENQKIVNNDGSSKIGCNSPNVCGFIN